MQSDAKTEIIYGKSVFKFGIRIEGSLRRSFYILGAFGCGAFRNDSEVVTRAYKTVLQEFPRVFRQIEFAVYCPPGGSKNYDVFNKTFGNMSCLSYMMR